MNALSARLIVLYLLPVLTIGGWYIGRWRAVSLTHGQSFRVLDSRPAYYGTYLALWCLIPAFVVWFLWVTCEGLVVRELTLWGLPLTSATSRSLLFTEIENAVSRGIVPEEMTELVRSGTERYREFRTLSQALLLVLALGLAGIGCFVGYRSLSATLRAREKVERALQWFLVGSSLIAIATTIGIVASLVFESVRFFGMVSPIEFLTGTKWSPQIAMRADQVAGSGSFGAIPLFLGTGLISLIAMSVAVPVGLMAAIYLSEYATPRFRAVAKPLLEVLAGIPTVVYGFFAALTVAPFIRGVAGTFGLSASSESALAAGLVMGVMIIPFVSSLSDDMLHAVPRSLREGSLALGATRSETIQRVLLPAALPGIVGAILLAVSRAVGETMIVVMAAGLSANLTVNPLESVTTVTVQIVTTLVGDQEFDSPKTLAAFALGFTLFLCTLTLNLVALQVVKRYRERYD